MFIPVNPQATPLTTFYIDDDSTKADKTPSLHQTWPDKMLSNNIFRTTLPLLVSKKESVFVTLNSVAVGYLTKWFLIQTP